MQLPFGPFVFDVDRRVLLRDGERVKLTVSTSLVSNDKLAEAEAQRAHAVTSDREAMRAGTVVRGRDKRCAKSGAIALCRWSICTAR